MRLNVKEAIQSLSTTDRILVILGIFIATVISLYIAYAQGTFQKSNVEITFEGAPPISEDKTNTIFVLLNRDITTKDLTFIPIQFDLKNSGGKALENVELSISFDKRGKHASNFFDESVYDHHGMMMADNLRHESNSTNDFDYSNFKILKLNLGDHPMIQDGVFAYSMPYQSPIDLPILGLSNFGAHAKIDLEADNIPKKSFNFDYQVEKFNSMDELIDWYKSYYLKAIVVRKRQLMSMPEYFFKLLFSREEEVAYFSESDYQFATISDGKVWIPKEGTTAMKATSAKLYYWSLLFDK